MSEPADVKERPLEPRVTRAYRPDVAPAADPARSGGAEGNERLTAWTGAVLFVLLAAEGVTILKVGRLLTPHFFIGMLLLGPVALKAGSTIYRFFRYYTGSAPYRRKGPPAPLLRLLGPLVIASTAGVFGSGIALAVVGPGKGPWLFLHKGSFVVWFCAMAVHVLWYLPRLPRLLAGEFGGYSGQHSAARLGSRVGRRLGGRGMRIFLLLASLACGLVIALLTAHLAAPWHAAKFGGN
jgi:hypothetical protein